MEVRSSDAAVVAPELQMEFAVRPTRHDRVDRSRSLRFVLCSPESDLLVLQIQHSGAPATASAMFAEASAAIAVPP